MCSANAMELVKAGEMAFRTVQARAAPGWNPSPPVSRDYTTFLGHRESAAAITRSTAASD